MDIRYSKYKPSKSSLLAEEFKSIKDLFWKLYLRADGDIEQTFDWMNQVLKQNGWLQEGHTFEDVIDELTREGILEQSEDIPELSAMGNKFIRDVVFEKIFKGFSQGVKGGHISSQVGKIGERQPDLRPYQFGDEFSNIDFSRTLQNSMKRQQQATLSDIREEDMEIYESENHVSCATVLMIDISHSMILYGEDRITPAKMVAMALVEFVRRYYPRDTIDVITFGNEAKEIDKERIAEISIGPYHTNTADGLKLAQHLLKKRRNVNKQIFMITDGKPSAVYDQGRLYKNSMGLDPIVLKKTFAEARMCRKNRIAITTFMVAQDNYLIEFIEELTHIVGGQAFYTGLGDLGEIIFLDYVNQRRRRMF